MLYLYCRNNMFKYPICRNLLYCHTANLKGHRDRYFWPTHLYFSILDTFQVLHHHNRNKNESGDLSVHCSWFRVHCSWFRVQGSLFRVLRRAKRQSRLHNSRFTIHGSRLRVTPFPDVPVNNANVSSLEDTDECCRRSNGNQSSEFRRILN